MSEAYAMGAIVPPEVACRCDILCTGDLSPTDLPDPSNWCRHCGHMDAYDPCPRTGFGCGTSGGEPCDCCTPEQWKNAAGAGSA